MSTKKTVKKVVKKEAPANYLVVNSDCTGDSGYEIDIKGAPSADEIVKQLNKEADWFLSDNEGQTLVVFKEVGRYKVTSPKPVHKLVKTV